MMFCKFPGCGWIGAEPVHGRCADGHPYLGTIPCANCQQPAALRAGGAWLCSECARQRAPRAMPQPRGARAGSSELLLAQRWEPVRNGDGWGILDARGAQLAAIEDPLYILSAIAQAAASAPEALDILAQFVRMEREVRAAQPSSAACTYCSAAHPADSSYPCPLARASGLLRRVLGEPI